MSIIQAWISGLRRGLAQPGMTLWLYVLNLLVALPLAMACRSVLSDGLDGSMALSNLMAGLDYTVWQDFSNVHGQELSAAMGQLLWVILLSMLLSTFLSGGILSELRAGREKFSTSSFFAGCGTYFSRFFRLFLIFGVSLLVMATLLVVVLSAAGDALTENAASEITYIWVRGISVVIFLVPVMLLLMIADYAKLSVVVNNDRSMLKTAWRAMQFVLRRVFKTFGLELSMLLVPVVLFGVYLILDLSIGMTTGATILVMFILQQLFLFSRAWTKVFFFAGELALYQSLQPIASPVVEAGSGPPEMETVHV